MKMNKHTNVQKCRRFSNPLINYLKAIKIKLTLPHHRYHTDEEDQQLVKWEEQCRDQLQEEALHPDIKQFPSVAPCWPLTTFSKISNIGQPSPPTYYIVQRSEDRGRLRLAAVGQTQPQLLRPHASMLVINFPLHLYPAPPPHQNQLERILVRRESESQYIEHRPSN